MAINQRVREYSSRKISSNGGCNSVSLPKGLEDTEFPYELGQELIPELREQPNGPPELVYRPKGE